MNILAVDPGGTTGWARWEAEGAETFFASGQSTPENFCFTASKIMHSRSGGYVVCENFIPRPGAKTWEPDAIHIIGWLRFQAPQFGWRFTTPVMPSTHKRFSTDAKLKRAGWWVPGQDHARDALRVLMWFLCTQMHDDALIQKVAV